MTTYNVLTLFPEMFDSVCGASIWARAIKAGHIAVNTVNIRDWATDKHRRADDYPLGGGVGMVLKPEPADACFNHLESGCEAPAINIYMSPCGKTLSHTLVTSLSEFRTINILCGHYEGVDARIIKRHIDIEVSIGDYVLTGGELAAMVLIDACIRHVDGVLGNGESAAGESFSESLLEFPQYTRPALFGDDAVPEVLLSGHHANVEKYRRRMSLKETAFRRPDLLSKARLTKKDIDILTSDDE